MRCWRDFSVIAEVSRKIPLYLELFGGFRASTADGEQVNISAVKSQALLAYLSLTAPRPQTRTKLCDLLWPNANLERARTSLRQEIQKLRRNLPKPFALDDIGGSISLPVNMVHTDVGHFSRKSSDALLSNWRSALGVYEGELLAGLDNNSEIFEEWLQLERRRWQVEVVTVGRKIIDQLRRDRDQNAIVEVTEKLLAIDPLLEDIHHQRIAALLDLGERGRPKSCYDDLRELLSEELGVRPAHDTEKLLMPTGPARHPSVQDPPESNQTIRQAINYLQEAAERVFRLGLHREAATLTEQALQLLTSLHSDQQEIELNLRLRLRTTYLALDELAAAQKELQIAERRAASISSPKLAVRLKLDQAQLFRQRGQHDASDHAGRDALAMARAAADNDLVAISNLRLGAAHYARGRYREAINVLEENLHLLPFDRPSSNDWEPGDIAVRTRSWLVWACNELGRFEDAVRIGDDGLLLARTTDDLYSRVHIHIARASTEFRQRSFAAALDWYEKTAQLAAWAELPIFDPLIRVPQAVAQAELGDIAAARNTAAGLEYRHLTAIVRTTLADYFILCGDLAAAEKNNREAIDMAQKQGEVGDLGWTYFTAARLRKLRKGNWRPFALAAQEIATRFNMQTLKFWLRERGLEP